MKCTEIQKLLSPRQDGQISFKETIAIEKHLPGCPACQQEKQALSNVWTMLKTLEPIPPSANFKARFWQNARKREKPSLWRRFVELWDAQDFFAHPALAMSSLLLAVVLGTIVTLKVLPLGASQPNSSLTEWAQSVRENSLSGKFQL